MTRNYPLKCIGCNKPLTIEANTIKQAFERWQANHFLCDDCLKDIDSPGTGFPSPAGLGEPARATPTQESVSLIEEWRKGKALNGG